MRLLLYKRAFRRKRVFPNPFVDMEAGDLMEATRLAMMHVGAAEVEGRRLSALVVSGDSARVMIVSHGGGRTSISATSDSCAVLDEHWPGWREEGEP